MNTQTARPPCYVHIGAPKTGSTYLQGTFAKNAGALLREGILYPNSGLRAFGHHDFAFLLNGGYPDWARPQPQDLSTLSDQLSAEVGSYTGALLFSSENFYLFPQPKKLQLLLQRVGAAENRRIVVIVYIRRQDSAHESWYNQTIKAWGETYGVERCVEKFDALWDYRQQLDSWAAVFGRENLIVRPYEREQFDGGSLLSDFARCISVDHALLATEEVIENQRLNRDILHFQLLLNRLPLSPVQKRQFHRSLIELSVAAVGTGLFDERPLLTAKAKSAIMARYAESNAEVAQKYLGRSRLFQKWPEEQAAEADRERVLGLSVDKLGMILGWLLVKHAGETKTR